MPHIPSEAESSPSTLNQRVPGAAGALVTIGRSHLMRGERTLAGQRFLDALRLEPARIDALEGLARVFLDSGIHSEALSVLEKACRIQPDHVPCRLMLANLLLALGRLDESSSIFNALWKEGDRTASVIGGLAAVAAAFGDFERASELFVRALAVEPDNRIVNWNYALFLLRRSVFVPGWERYEVRTGLGATAGVYERDWGLRKWAGTSLDGLRLVVTREQGLGDELMFASTYHELVRDAAHCTIECDSRLEALFRRSFPSATILGVSLVPKWPTKLVSALASQPTSDCWIPAGSVPRLRRRASSEFSRHSGYLTPDRRRVDHWRQRLHALGPGLKVGISWRGGTISTNSDRRSVTPGMLIPILTTPGVHFFNLQYGDSEPEVRQLNSDAGVSVQHWGDALQDYDETAAFVTALDLTLSVCTAVVHLGGALGRPVWVMAPHVAEWRYGETGDSMIWYPSVRVFRQTSPDSWEGTIARVAGELRQHRDSVPRAPG